MVTTGTQEIFAMFDSDPTFDRPQQTVTQSHGHHGGEEGAGQFTDAIAARQFIRAGKSTFTIRSEKTGTRFTYRVNVSNDGNVHFVALLNGADNDSNYQFLGILSRDMYRHGRKSRVTEEAASVKAFKWFWGSLARGQFPASVKMWHEGKCGRCGRTLTVPESIESGYGPECVTKLN